jgi:hypothetical protein
MLIRLRRWLPSEEEEPPPRLSRRRFLFLGATAAAGLIVAPTLQEIADVTFTAADVDRLMTGPSIDQILKEYYEPVVVEMCNNRNSLSLFIAADWAAEPPPEQPPRAVWRLGVNAAFLGGGCE